MGALALLRELSGWFLLAAAASAAPADAERADECRCFGRISAGASREACAAPLEFDARLPGKLPADSQFAIDEILRIREELNLNPLKGSLLDSLEATEDFEQALFREVAGRKTAKFDACSTQIGRCAAEAKAPCANAAAGEAGEACRGLCGRRSAEAPCAHACPLREARSSLTEVSRECRGAARAECPCLEPACRRLGVDAVIIREVVPYAANQPLPPHPVSPVTATLRGTARELDMLAADCEDEGAYDRADHLRELAARLRGEARGAAPEFPVKFSAAAAREEPAAWGESEDSIFSFFLGRER